MRPGMRVLAASAAAACLFGAVACATPTSQDESSAAGPATVTVVSTVESQSTKTITAQVPAVSSPEQSSTTTGSSDGSCRIEQLNVTIGEGEGAAGSSYYPLTFTNKGFTPCTLEGFPEVAYVTGDDLHQVGGAAAENGEAGTPITLQPGAHTSAALQEVVVANFDADVCDPTPVKGLRVALVGGDEAAFVPQDGQTGCAATDLPGGQFQMSVQTFGAMD